MASKENQKVLIFDTEEELSISLAEHTAKLSNQITSHSATFTVVLSGGTLIDSLRWVNDDPNLFHQFF